MVRLQRPEVIEVGLSQLASSTTGAGPFGVVPFWRACASICGGEHAMGPRSEPPATSYAGDANPFTRGAEE
jgi:hypothetical protein